MVGTRWPWKNKNSTILPLSETCTFWGKTSYKSFHTPRKHLDWSQLMGHKPSLPFELPLKEWSASYEAKLHLDLPDTPEILGKNLGRLSRQS